ncbi:MAG: orotate phosphoribosyltransferase [Bdellovibrionota bacterium]
MVSVDSITLLKEIQQRCVKKGAEFKLASGATSSIYVDSKGITLHAASLKLLSDYFWQVWKDSGRELPQNLAGVSVGGDPLASALALKALDFDIDANILLVRKERKDHGGSEGRAVEGKIASQVKGKVFLVEDVMSTGASSAKALAFMRAEGYVVDEMWAIVDREMGAIERIEKEFSIPVRSLFKLSDLA